MDFRQLRYIVTVADCRSVTKAASILYMTQPALSHFILKLEKELGVPLFDRSTVPLSLTYAGEEYVSNARKILMLHENTVKKIQDIRDCSIGRIRLGMPRDRASYMFPILSPRFSELYPNIQLKLITAGGAELQDML